MHYSLVALAWFTIPANNNSTVHCSLVVLAWFRILAENNSIYSIELQSGSGRFLCLRRRPEQEFEKDTGAGFPSEIQIKHGSKNWSGTPSSRARRHPSRLPPLTAGDGERGAGLDGEGGHLLPGERPAEHGHGQREVEPPGLQRLLGRQRTGGRVEAELAK